GRPDEQLLEATPGAPPALVLTFEALMRSIRQHAGPAATPNASGDAFLTRVRRHCRRVIEAAWPVSFGRGYTFLLEVPERVGEIEARLADAQTPAAENVDAFIDCLLRFARSADVYLRDERVPTSRTRSVARPS